MTYENIKFNKSNMAVDNGYFFMLDDGYQMLIQKCDDGSVAFQYPLEISKDLLISDPLNTASCLHFDGFSFWSLHSITDNSGVVVRRWETDGMLCNLSNQFRFDNDGSNTYSTSTISTEHYNTTVNTTVSGGQSTLNIYEYSNTVVFPDTVLGLGPNTYGNRESVTVSGVINDTIYLNAPTIYSYEVGDAVVITPTFFMFNNYFGTSGSTGSLMVFNANTGNFLSEQDDIEYKNVSASKFTRLQNVLQDYDDVYTLIYIKNNSGKLRNMSDLIGESSSYRGSDDFNSQSIDEEIWSISSGDPTIYDNKLFMSTVGLGHDKVTSNYTLLGDFDVQISGSLDGFTNTLDQFNIYHYISLNESGSSDDYMLSKTVSSGINYISVIKDTSGNFTTLSGNPTLSDDYFFRLTRVNQDINFYYKDVLEDSWGLLYTDLLFDTECYLSLGLKALAATVSGTYFDDLVYNSGRLRFPSPSVPYYGIMNLENIETDQATFIPIHDLDVVGDNLYRLQGSATYYGGDYNWSTYNYQISPIRQFADFITVDSDTHIVPATGRNTVYVTSLSLDQYGQGMVYTPITFEDDDTVGFMTSSTVYTPINNKSGEASSTYYSGTELRLVNIKASVIQVD